MRSKQFILFFAVLIAALCLRLSIASQGLTYLDRMFLPDDTYYTLSIARSLAAGAGPSASGEVLTSGFQPLTAFVMVPVYLLGAGLDAAVYISILISALFGAVACALFALLIHHSTRSTPVAAVAGLLAVTSPLILRNDLNGLETSAAMALSLASILLFVRLPERPSTTSTAILGAFIGLMILARVDTAVMALLIGVSILARFSIAPSAKTALAALIVVSPWWAYCTLRFGSPVPESGAAVRQLITAAGDGRLSHMEDLRIAVTTLLGSLQLNALPTPTGLATLIAGALATLIMAPRAKESLGVVTLILCGAIFTAFYVAYLPAFWFFHRYLHFVFFAVIACAVVLPAFMFRNVPALRNSVALGLGIFIIALNIKGVLPFYSKPEGTMYGGVDGAKGYREVAQEILSAVPSGATIGSAQSGALGYYADRGISVVNLDGVVDRGAFNAIKSRSIADYIVGRKVGYIAGWQVNMIGLQQHSTASSAKLHLMEVGRFKRQQGDQFVLYTVTSN
ncbi:glycosyltransferase family 39 protein [Pseudomonas sp. QE6]|uniref:hypothetical protein n=1 Tax=Pseudomonas sp. QE6 TaxID=3242491 RepID=UPI00352779B1